MDSDLLIRKFEAIGARARIRPAVRDWSVRVPRAISLDVRRDGHGEYFDLKVDDVQVEHMDAVDVRPRERHLLLVAWARPYVGDAWTSGFGRRLQVILPPRSEALEKPRFLCGHDERHWFVAAIPERAHASTVRTAMEALKPEAVIEAQARANVRFDRRFDRKNRAFKRQGEWFFLPAPELVVPRAMIFRNEPMQRSGGKAHWAEEAFRLGGEVVYVSRGFPQGLPETEYRAYIARHPEDRRLFRIMRRNARMFVRGRIAHPDHATVVLNGWHEVLMNTENRAKAQANVVFLD